MNSHEGILDFIITHDNYFAKPKHIYHLLYSLLEYEKLVELKCKGRWSSMPKITYTGDKFKLNQGKILLNECEIGTSELMSLFKLVPLTQIFKEIRSTFCNHRRIKLKPVSRNKIPIHFPNTSINVDKGSLLYYSVLFNDMFLELPTINDINIPFDCPAQVAKCIETLINDGKIGTIRSENEKGDLEQYIATMEDYTALTMVLKYLNCFCNCDLEGEARGLSIPTCLLPYRNLIKFLEASVGHYGPFSSLEGKYIFIYELLQQVKPPFVTFLSDNGGWKNHMNYMGSDYFIGPMSKISHEQVNILYELVPLELLQQHLICMFQRMGLSLYTVERMGQKIPLSFSNVTIKIESGALFHYSSFIQEGDLSNITNLCLNIPFSINESLIFQSLIKNLFHERGCERDELYKSVATIEDYIDLMKILKFLQIELVYL